MNNAVFRKTIENVRKHIKLGATERRSNYVRKHIKLGTRERRNNYVVSEPSYHTTKISTEYPLAIEMKETEILINKPIYLGLSTLELSKILMYEFWYDYVKLKYGEKVKLCYMNTNSFIPYIKTDNIYKDIAEDIKTRFDASNYELDRS